MNVTISMNRLLDFINSMSLSANNKEWLAERLINEVKAERNAAINAKKDEMFYRLAGAWKDDAEADAIIDAIQKVRSSGFAIPMPRIADL